MPTYEQLQAEPWWNREIVTPELRGLGEELCRRTGRPREAWGDKGNNRHLNGGHRSQEWIKNSVYCTNRTYTVQSGLTADQYRHIGAGDFTPGIWGTASNRVLVAEQTGRLWDAAQRGKLVGITQVEGTLDTRTPIGLNIGSGTTFMPDYSHLDHWHLTFDRRYLTDANLMRRIANIALGTTIGGSDMYCNYGDTNSSNVWVLQAELNDVLAYMGVPTTELLQLDWWYGDQTAAALMRVGIGNPSNNGRAYGPGEYKALQDKLREIAARRFGQPGPKGDKGDAGIPGRTPSEVVVAEGTVLKVVATQ